VNHAAANAITPRKSVMNTTAKTHGISVIAVPSMILTVRLGVSPDNREMRHGRGG